MKYICLGDKLGGMPEDRKFYDTAGNVEYKILAEDPYYLDGIRQIIDLSLKENICLMCAEAEPRKCHRTSIVSESLWKYKIESLHILHDSSIVKHGDLRIKIGQNQGDLFRDMD